MSGSTTARDQPPNLSDAPTLDPARAPLADLPTIEPATRPSANPNDDATLDPAPDLDSTTGTFQPLGTATDLQDVGSRISSAEVDLDDGPSLGPYRRLEPLRAWTHGTVYRAYHPKLKREVELRVLDAPHAEDPEMCARFAAMARRLSSLSHPNVDLTVLEARSDAATPYIAIAREDDEPLSHFAPRTNRQRKQEQLFPNEALYKASRDLGRGLDAIHRAGVAHGQLTDGCFRIKKGGNVRISGLADLDFFTAPVDELAETERETDRRDLGRALLDAVGAGNAAALASGKLKPFIKASKRANPGLRTHWLAAVRRLLLPVDAGGWKSTWEFVTAVDPKNNPEFKPARGSDRFLTCAYDFLFVLLFTIVGAAVCTTIAEILVDEGYLSSTTEAIVVNFIPSIGSAIVGLLTYQALMEWTFGWTIGRRFKQMRLVDSSAERPPRRMILKRWFYRAGLVSIAMVLIEGITLAAYQWAALNYKMYINQQSCLWLAGIVGIVVVVAALQASGRLIPNGWAVHDYLSGVFWVQPLEDEGMELSSSSVEISRQTLAYVHFEKVESNSTVERIDQYELRQLLGQGGMGAVYAAWDTELRRPAAIKLNTSGSFDARAHEVRFAREAELGAQLSHPNIAKVYGVGHRDGAPYMAMEYISGESLQELAKRCGAIPIEEAWSYIEQAALGLREADRAGIVHRDIKPANLMRAEDGTIKITDFGISRRFEETDVPDPFDETEIPETGARREANLTMTGALIGTPMYMSPEQACGKRLDCRADIYSLGLTLYCLLAGKTPFPKSDPVDLATKQCTEEPESLRGSINGLTATRSRILARMIAKDPAARYPNYDVLLADLRAEAPRQAILASPTTRLMAEIGNMVALWFGIMMLGGMMAIAAAAVAAQEGAERFQAVKAIMVIGVPILLGGFAWMYIWGVGRHGRTYGKRHHRLAVRRLDNSLPGLWRAALRFVVCYPLLPYMVLNRLWVGVGKDPYWDQLLLTQLGLVAISILLMYFTKSRRTIHDRLAGTKVVQLARVDVERPGFWRDLYPW